MSKKARQAKGTRVATPVAPDLPEGWTAAPLHAVTLDVQSINPLRQPAKTWRYADIGGVDSARNVVAEVRTFLGKDAPSRARRPVESGDVLFSNVRVNLRRIAAISDPAPVDVCSTGFTLLRSNGAIAPTFLLHSVLRSEFIEEVADTQTGTQYPATSDRQVRGVSVLIPPMAEQQRIAEKLDQVGGRVAAARERLTTLPTNINLIRKAVMSAACSGRLTEDWRADHQRKKNLPSPLLAMIQEKRREQWQEEMRRRGRDPSKARYPEPASPTDDFVADLPSTWAVASMEALTSMITSGSRDWTQYYKDDGPGTFIMAQNVRPMHFDRSYRLAVDPPENNRDRERSQVRRGDVLVTIVGANTGDVCRIPEHLDQHYVCQSVALMRPVLESTSRWLELWLNSPDHGQRQYRDWQYGDGRPHLGFDHLKATAVGLPPLEEQEEILRRVELLLAVIAKLEVRVRAAQDRLSSIVASCSAAAFAGELVPTEAALAGMEGRTYESGEQLLARIRSQPAPASRTREAAHEASDVSLPRVLIMKKLQEIGKTHLFDLLAKRNKGMTPEELLAASELDVDEFFTQLKREVEAKKVKETRKGKTGILLEAAR